VSRPEDSLVEDYTYDPDKPRTKIVIKDGQEVEVLDTNNLHATLEAYVRSLGLDEGQGFSFADLALEDPEVTRLLDEWRTSHPERFAAVVGISRQKREALAANGELSVINADNLAQVAPATDLDAEREIICSEVMGDLIELAERVSPGYNPNKLGI